MGRLIAATGRNLDGTLNAAANGHANLYVRNENMLGMQFGLTVGGLWIDQVHLRIYLPKDCPQLEIEQITLQREDQPPQVWDFTKP